MAHVSEVKLTEKIRKALQDAVDSNRISNSDKLEFKSILSEDSDGQKTVTFQTVRNLSKALSSAGEKVYIHELLKGSDVHLPTVDLPPKLTSQRAAEILSKQSFFKAREAVGVFKWNPELVARLEKLRAQAENKEYERMVGNVVEKKNPLDFSIGQDVKAINRQMTSVLNFIITVVAAFVFGYKGSELLLGITSIPQRLTYGLVLGMVVFFADLYFLVKHTESY